MTRACLSGSWTDGSSTWAKERHRTQAKRRARSLGRGLCPTLAAEAGLGGISLSQASLELQSGTPTPALGPGGDTGPLAGLAQWKVALERS